MDGPLVAEPGERAALDRIRGLRAAGVSVDRIVQRLNAVGETIRGGRWHATTIRRALRREAA
jgi:hypothetical protein